jgi:hypothetical protein
VSIVKLIINKMDSKLEFKLDVLGLEELKSQAKKIVELSKSLEIAIEELNKMELSIKTS